MDKIELKEMTMVMDKTKVQKDEDTKSDEKKDDIARESEGKHCNRWQ
jgi:hypothetical protein